MALESVDGQLRSEYQVIHGRRLLFIAALVLGCIVLAMLSLGIGSVGIGYVDVVRTLLGDAPDVFTNSIVWNIRFPRMVMALVAGVGLAVAGASMQGVLRNPLVDPFTLGIASGAALGASMAIVLRFTLPGLDDYMIVGNAFAFSLMSSFLILGLGRMRGVSPETFILVGIALTFVFGALTGVLQYVASDAQIAELVSWSFGSLSRPTSYQTVISLVAVGVCVPLLLSWSWKLNAVSLSGDEVAQSLGVNPGRLRMKVMVVSSLITASIIAFTGILGFVGLVAPHIARLLVGGDHRYMMAVSGLLGAVLLLVSDVVGRTLFAPTIIPVGIMLSLMGGPFFLYILMRRRSEFWK